MRKKLAVVLGLSKNADVLLLDEPSNGLDRNSVVTLHSVLKEYKKEKTVIVASHDASFFDPELVDRILVLKDRKIEEYRDDLFDYSYYFVRTKNELTADAAMIARRPGPDSYVVKVMPGEEDKAAASLIPFGLLEYRKLDYADSFYSENLL